MKITIVSDLLKSPANSEFEIVERKGRGHPDTLSDRLAELLSVTYSKYTRDKYGAILRHQFDKLSLMGGKCDIRFGGGNFTSPIRLLINGRATPKIGNETIEFKDLLINTAAHFLEEEFLKFIKWLRGETGTEKQKEISSKLKYLIIVDVIVMAKIIENYLVFR